MQTPERTRSALAVASRVSPVQARPGAAPAASDTSPARRTSVWREVQNQVHAEGSLYAGTAGARAGSVPAEPVAQVSYSVGTRQAPPVGTQPGSARMVLQADKVPARPADAVFDMLDRNHDGVISQAEWRQAMVQQAMGQQAAQPAPGGGSNLAGMRRNLDAQRTKLQALAGGTDARHDSPTSAPERRAANQMQDLRKGFAALNQEQELQVAFVQDSVKEAEYTRSSLTGLSHERDRLQRQVQEQQHMHEQQRHQTSELRSTLADMQTESRRLQAEQSRQARALAEGGRKGSPTSDVAATTQMARQADNMREAVSAQDKKFQKLESDLTAVATSQRSQLSEALQQGRSLARALEEEGQRRSQSVAELQSLIANERQRDGGAAARLQQELQGATNAIQAQSSDWVNLARCIKSEVGTLAQELRTDRENRSIEASNQRHEITRMLDNARRQNVEHTVGSYDGPFSDQGTDMMSRAGSVAVRKMVDTTKSLLHGLEEALIMRAGFIAGVFHTWRCETTLMKAGRRYQEEFLGMQDQWEAHMAGHTRTFEEELMRAAETHKSHRDIVRDKYGLLVGQMMHGNLQMLVLTIVHRWREAAASRSSRARNAATIQKSMYQWLEGELRGALHASWNAWKHETIHNALERKHRKEMEGLQQSHLDAMGKVLSEGEAKVLDGFKRLESRHLKAKRDLEMVIGKWAMGEMKGTLLIVLQALYANTQQGKAAKKQSLATQEAVKKFLAGNTRGIKMSVWTSWKSDALHSRALVGEAKRLQDLLDNERAERERDQKAATNTQQLMKDAARANVHLAAEKWAAGSEKGLRKTVIQEWRTACGKQAESDRRTQSVHLQLEKWLEGDKRGRMHSCFMAWSHSSQVASAEKKGQKKLEEETGKLKDFMEDKDKAYQVQLNKAQTEAERLKAEAFKAVESTIMKWQMGESKGGKKAVFLEWFEYVKKIKGNAERHNAVKSALLRSMEGESRASIHVCFSSWHNLMTVLKVNKSEGDKVEMEKRHWEERQKQLMSEHEKAMEGKDGLINDLKGQAHSTIEMMLKRTFGGDDAGIKSSVFVDWKRLTSLHRDGRKKHMAARDAMTRFLLGETRGILKMHLLSWYNMSKMESAHKSRIDQLEKQVDKLLRHQELRLAKYATAMGSASLPALKKMVLKEWRDVAQGVKYLELEREKEVELEEMKRHKDMQADHKKLVQAKAAEALCKKGGRALLLEYFIAWKYQYELAKDTKAHKLNRNGAMKELATQMIMKQLKKDDASLKASCFAEWRHEGKVLRYEETHQGLLGRHAGVQDQLGQTTMYASQLEQRVLSLEENLQNTYQQVDMITITLQKELQCKEELTRELRDAYEKMRQNAFSPTSAVGSGMLLGGASMGLQASGGQPSDAIFGSLDRNHDGVITRAEWNRAMASGAANGVSAAPRSQRTSLAGPPQEPLAAGPGTRSQRPSLGGSGTAGGSGSRASSPGGGKCDWNSVLGRMREERLIRLGESSGT